MPRVPFLFPGHPDLGVQRAAVKEKAVLFAELAKLRLSSLVATSSLFGYAFGAPVAFDLPYVATATCVTVGTLLCSASANTINQVGSFVEVVASTSTLRVASRHPSPVTRSPPITFTPPRSPLTLACTYRLLWRSPFGEDSGGRCARMA